MATKSTTTKQFDGFTNAAIVLSCLDPLGAAKDFIWVSQSLMLTMYDNSSGVWLPRVAVGASTIAQSDVFGSYDGSGAQFTAAHLLAQVNAMVGPGYT